jgi:hypothetical protein
VGSRGARTRLVPRAISSMLQASGPEAGLTKWVSSQNRASMFSCLINEQNSYIQSCNWYVPWKKVTSIDRNENSLFLHVGGTFLCFGTSEWFLELVPFGEGKLERDVRKRCCVTACRQQTSFLWSSSRRALI